ncbi:MAG TPA: hypothetical protein VLE96_04185 [Chlamydiales bacterium]|nr:hypothetical protein [Chlamydiales bacterium]
MTQIFQALQPWLPQILHSIKKEIKIEHLAKSPSFYKEHFGNRPLNRLTNEEISNAYEKELLQGNQELEEWVINRWVFRHGDIYQHFAERLSQINPDFSEIKTLDDRQSESVLTGAPERFGSLFVYLFAVLNGVVLAPETLEMLRQNAEKEEKTLQEKEVHSIRQASLEEMLENQKNEMLRLEKKYEEKLAGVVKKHAIDVEALKKQIRALQKK